MLEAGNSTPVIFNAANEIAVEAFLMQRIGFLQIPSIVSAALDVCEAGKVNELDDVLEFDRLARLATSRLINATEVT